MPVRQRIPCAVCGKLFLPRDKRGKVCSQDCRTIYNKEQQKRIDRERSEDRKRYRHGLPDKSYQDWLDDPEKHPRDPFAGSILSWDGLHAIGYDEVPRAPAFNLGF